MATMRIPPELKLCIADYLDPSSSINFALTCKEHWRLCERIVKAHARGFAEAPVLNSHYTGTDTWQALKDVLRDPRKGWYITEISLTSSWSDYHYAAFEENVDEFQNAATALMDLYTRSSSDTMVETGYSGLYGSHMKEECIIKKIRDSIAIGTPDGAVAILVHHLPNLKTLRITMSRDNDAFVSLLHWIALEYSNSAKAPRLPFQRLKTAALSHYDTESHISANWALPFLRIPSLRTFAVNMMGGHFRGEKGWSPVALGPPPRSNIEEFCFVGCKFDARAVECLIGSTHSLKRFLYADGGACVGDDMYNPKVVIRALDKYARHSLEHMVLDHMEYEEEETLFRDGPTMYGDDDEEDDDESNKDGDESSNCKKLKRPTEVDLSKFTKLRTLSAIWAMLWPELYHDIPVENARYHFSPNLERSCAPLDIRTILPPSLEMLHLYGAFQEEEWEGVTGPLATPNEQTPHLTMDRIKIKGYVHPAQRERQQYIVSEGQNSVEKRVFGRAETRRPEGDWPPIHLFNGHGW